nr:hypothetical protein [Fredinandcohnia onubensis]
MAYEMRALKTADIFKMSKILKKMNIKFELDSEVTQEAMGIQLIQKVVENLHLAEDEVNEFLGNLVGLEAKKFSELPIEDTLQIISLFKGQKGIVNFLKLAGK